MRMISSAGFDIGRNSLSPITEDYKTPFEFTGVIKKINIKLPRYRKPSEVRKDAEHQFQALMEGREWQQLFLRLTLASLISRGLQNISTPILLVTRYQFLFDSSQIYPRPQRLNSKRIRLETRDIILIQSTSKCM